MKSLQTEKQFSYKGLLYKLAIFVVTVCVIVYFFLPREGRFNYQFDINKPWKYGLLQASFDFPIYKDDAEVQREQDSIMRLYSPYYQMDKTVADRMIQQFKKAYTDSLHRIIPAPAYQMIGKSCVKTVYVPSNW